MITQTIRALATAVGILAAAGLPAGAQTQQGNPQQGNPQQGDPQQTASSSAAEDGGWHHRRMLEMCRDQDAHLAAMLAFDAVRLGITEAQRAAWNKLGETLRGAGEPVRRACAEMAQQPPAATLPARLEQAQKMAEARAAAMRTAVPAIEQFYNASLSPEQKKIADELAEHGCGMMHPHGHM